eukprot:15327482-Alexandrium_andersonii.AAC.1
MASGSLRPRLVATSPRTSESASSWVGAQPSVSGTGAARSISQSRKVAGSLLKSGVSIPVA